MFHGLYTDVFSDSAVFVAQTASLLFRRMSSCSTAPWPERLNSANALPIDNRRYSRLSICATLNSYESPQNPHAGKRALRSATAFPGRGFAELSSSTTGACSRRTLVGVSRGARVDPAGQLGLDKSTPLRHIFCRHVSDDDRQRRSSIVADN